LANFDLSARTAFNVIAAIANLSVLAAILKIIHKK